MGLKSDFEEQNKDRHVRRCAIFRPKSSEEQKKTLLHESFVHLTPVRPPPLDTPLNT